MTNYTLRLERPAFKMLLLPSSSPKGGELCLEMVFSEYSLVAPGLVTLESTHLRPLKLSLGLLTQASPLLLNPGYTLQWPRELGKKWLHQLLGGACTVIVSVQVSPVILKCSQFDSGWILACHLSFCITWEQLISNKTRHLRIMSISWKKNKVDNKLYQRQKGEHKLRI